MDDLYWDSITIPRPDRPRLPGEWRRRWDTLRVAGLAYHLEAVDRFRDAALAERLSTDPPPLSLRRMPEDHRFPKAIAVDANFFEERERLLGAPIREMKTLAVGFLPHEVSERISLWPKTMPLAVDFMHIAWAYEAEAARVIEIHVLVPAKEDPIWAGLDYP